MRVNDILVEDRSYLYEGLSTANVNFVKLWETAGRKIYEAALTADQIQQLFQQVEQGATAAGGNRTMIGQGKDLATAVKKAYDDLASKVQNSGPMQNVDQLYAQAAEKLKQATGGDAGAMQYVQKYRDFAKKHPVAQSLIYSALIAAAGISGAGLGGAAALGLFKMVDKLLQGEKFSTAVGKGLETGALAYGAGQIGKALQGGERVTSTTTTDTGVVDMPGNPALNQAMDAGQQAQQAASGLGRTALSTFQNDPTYGKQLATMIGDKQINPGWMQEFTKQLGRQVANPSDPSSMSQAWIKAGRIANTVAGNPTGPLPESRYIDRQSTVRMWALKESLNRPRGGMQLTEAGIARIFSLVEDLNTGTGTPNPKKPAPPPEEKQEPTWTGRKEAPAAKPDYSGGQKSVTPTVKNNQPPATNAAPAAEPASAPSTPNAGTKSFDQMTSQLANTGTSSTGGQTQGTATGLTHTSNPTNPNQPQSTTAPATDAAPPNNTAPAATAAAPATNAPPATNAAPAATTAAPAEPAKKGMLGRAADWAKTKGANLTNKVTADKLNTAWKKAGSPMDSDKVAQVLQGAGVEPQVINQAYTGLKIPAPAAAPADATATNADPAQANAPADATATNADPAQAQQDQQPANNKKPGFLSRLKKGFDQGIGGGADANASNNSIDDEENLKQAADILPQWKRFSAQYLAGYGNSPENLKKAAQAFAAKQFPGAGKQALQSGVESVTNPKSADVYVARMSNLAMVNDQSGVNPDQDANPAQQAPAVEPGQKKSGRVGKGAALKQVDQTVDAIKKVRTRDRPGVIQTAQTKIGALAGKNSTQPAGTAPAPEEEENPNIVRGYNEGLQFSESFDPGALLWKKLNR